MIFILLQVFAKILFHFFLQYKLPKEGDSFYGQRLQCNTFFILTQTTTQYLAVFPEIYEFNYGEKGFE